MNAPPLPIFGTDAKTVAAVLARWGMTHDELERELRANGEDQIDPATLYGVSCRRRWRSLRKYSRAEIAFFVETVVLPRLAEEGRKGQMQQ